MPRALGNQRLHLPAAVRLATKPFFHRLTPAHKLHNFNFRPRIHQRRYPQIPLHDGPIELHRNSFRFQIQRLHHIEKRSSLTEIPALAVDRNLIFL